MRRILYVIPSLRPGGAERQLGYLCQGIVPLGWDVHVATFEAEGPVRARVEASGATLHVRERAHVYDPRVVASLAVLTRKLRPDFVHTWLTTADVLGGGAALATGAPWILSDRSFVDDRTAPLKFKVLVKMAPRARAIVTNSDAAAASWGSRLAHAPPRFVVRNALPLDEVAAAPVADRASLGLPPGAPLIVTIGRLNALKNVMLLLEAFERVVRETGAVALLCGDGPLAGEARRFIDARGLAGRVLAPGYVGNAWSWLKAADVFVSASRLEGMPNSVMEAMAVGCPMVVSDIVSHREIVPPDAALFAPVDDVTALAGALRDTLTARDDARARAAVAARVAATWSIERVAERYAGIYEQIR